MSGSLFFFFISIYGVIAYSIERFIAVYWPLKYRVYFNGKIAMAILATCVLIPGIGTLPLCFVTTRVVHSESLKLPVCISNSDIHHPYFAAATTSLILFVLLLHAPLTAILFILIVIKIIKSSFGKIELGRAERSLSRTERRSVSTLLSVATMNLILYLPLSIIIAAHSFYRRFFPHSAVTIIILTHLSTLNYHITSLTHLLNFFVYITLIPSFRKTVLCKNEIYSSLFSSKSITALFPINYI